MSDGTLSIIDGIVCSSQQQYCKDGVDLESFFLILCHIYLFILLLFVILWLNVNVFIIAILWMIL